MDESERNLVISRVSRKHDAATPAFFITESSSSSVWNLDTESGDLPEINSHSYHLREDSSSQVMTIWAKLSYLQPNTYAD